MPPDAADKGLFKAFRALPHDSPIRSFAVVIAICVVCSVLVSTATVLLAPIQHANALRVRQGQILKAAGLLNPDADVVAQFTQITPRMVRLDSGEYVEAGDPVDFDVAAASRKPSSSRALPEADDIARIRREPNVMPVYLVQHEGKVDTVVLPVHGYGLWSTLYGYLALDGDGRTVKGITFYQHGETPGLGGEIDNPRWQAKWKGKEALSANGDVLIEVIKGEPRGDAANSEVDGLAGATLTSRGVSNLVRFWLGKQGFGPYLARLRAEREGAANEG